MAQKVIFLHCPDTPQSQMIELRKQLSENMDVKKYLFILSDKEIKVIDKEELLRILQK